MLRYELAGSLPAPKMSVKATRVIQTMTPARKRMSRIHSRHQHAAIPMPLSS